MTLQRWKAVLCGAAVLFLSGAARAQDAVQASAEGGANHGRTLTRTADFVVVHGRHFERNAGRSVDRLSLFAAVQGRLTPIPFQVDEVDADGDWILPHGPPGAGAGDADRITGDGRLGPADELVFMIRDAGDRFAGVFPEGMEDIEEMLLEDPVDGGRAWVYLGAFASHPPRSPVNYVEYRMPEGRIVSRDYELGFSETVPVSWDFVSLGGGPNMVDRLKIRAHVDFMGMRIEKNEEDFISEASGYKDGPVRVIRRSRNSIRITGRLHTPRADFESIYYDNAVIVPFRIGVPYCPRFLKRMSGLRVRVRGGCDMRNVAGWRLKPDVHPRWLTIDGRMDEEERTFDREGSTSLVLAGPSGAIFLRMILDRKWDGTPQSLPVETRLFYVDDDDEDDPPEFVPGQSPNIGFWMSGLENIPRGTFYFFMVSHMIGDYTDGEEAEWMKIMDVPVRVSVGPPES